MAEGTALTRDQVKEIVNDEDFNVDEMREVLAEEFDFELPQNLTTDEIVDAVYDVYLKKSKEVSEVRRSKRDDAKKKRSEGKDKDGGGTSRAGFVEGTIKDAGEITRFDVEKALDEAFGYSLAGKSPKTRVNRILRNLKSNNKIEIDGKTIRWIG